MYIRQATIPAYVRALSPPFLLRLTPINDVSKYLIHLKKSWREADRRATQVQIAARDFVYLEAHKVAL